MCWEQEQYARPSWCSVSELQAYGVCIAIIYEIFTIFYLIIKDENIQKQAVLQLASYGIGHSEFQLKRNIKILQSTQCCLNIASYITMYYQQSQFIWILGVLVSFGTVFRFCIHKPHASWLYLPCITNTAKPKHIHLNMVLCVCPFIQCP